MTFRNIFILTIAVFFSFNLRSQVKCELRSFYINEADRNSIIYCNNNKVILDSLGKFVLSTFKDSALIEFDGNYYPLILHNSAAVDTSFLIIYKFDKYEEIASSIYRLHKKWFGLIKNYTYEGGKTEVINPHDIFRNRYQLIIDLQDKKYVYRKSDRFDGHLILEIKSN